MSGYKINAYLSAAEKGVHLHILDLPGCFSRGSSEEEALHNLPEAVRIYLKERQRHGNALEIPETFEINIIERTGEATGPFDPGDTTALFKPELSAVSEDELQDYIQLAADNRADLIMLADSLPDKLLDWQPPEAHEFTIRKILRHIGNADKWYTSRIVQPEDLPPQWETDSDMPIYAFLEMSRRTAMVIFNSLSPTQRSGAILYPSHFTSNPNEPWTLRKALRRLLEHEREHIGHILEILESYRHHILKLLHNSRRTVEETVNMFDKHERATRLVTGKWTLKQIIGHLTDWEKLGVEYGQKTLLGKTTEKLPEFETGSIDSINAIFEAARRDQTWEYVWEEYCTTRDAMIALLESITGDVLTRKLVPPWGGEQTLSSFFKDWPGHDDEHVRMIRKESGLTG